MGTRILDDHKKVKNKLIPPMLQLPNMQMLSYVDNILPDLIWIGLVINKFGINRGCELFLKVCELAEETNDSEVILNLPFQSGFSRLTTEQQSEFRRKLDQFGLLNSLQDAIAPLTILYPECPLSFMGCPLTPPTEQVLVSEVYHCVDRFIDNRDQDGAFLCSMPILYKAKAGHLHFGEKIDIPDFNAILNDWGSEGASRAASFTRANIMIMAGEFANENGWAKYFWDRNFIISKCETGEVDG